MPLLKGEQGIWIRGAEMALIRSEANLTHRIKKGDAAKGYVNSAITIK